MRAPVPATMSPSLAASRSSTPFWENPAFRNFAGNALTDLGYGLTRGHDISSGLAHATQRTAEMQPTRDAYATQQKAEQERQAQLNQTVQFLQEKHPDLAAMVESGMPVGEAWGAALERMKPNGGAGAPSYGLTPIWGVGPDGQPTIAQLSNQGGIQPIDLPEGFNVAKDPIRMDAGTHFVLLDPVTRQQIGIIPKENQQAAFDTATGAGLGKTNAENIAAAESLSSKLPGLRKVVGELSDLAKTATYTVSGQLIDNAMREAGMEPSEAAVARARYIAMVDNQVLPLLRDTFGAQFTVQEGESLRATLGDPNKSPEEKQAVLESFIAQKERDVEAMRSRIPSQGGAPAAGGTRTTSTGVTYTVGQ